MLCGLTGSGKTTYAKKLLESDSDLIRQSIDELIFEKHGRYGIDYPEDKYFDYYYPALEEYEKIIINHLGAGRSIILDHGFWKKADRDRYKKLIEDHGGAWRLLYFKVEAKILFERVRSRNLRQDANALFVSDEALTDFISRFEEPIDEGGELIEFLN